MATSEPEVGISRRERRKRELRARVLEAAEALFDERGFEATKVAEICERADVAHKTFFNHFPTKQHLLGEFAREALDRLLADVDEARAQPGPTAERLRYFFQRLAEDAEAAGPMRRELLNELIHVAHTAGTETEQARRLHESFAALVRDGIKEGDVTRAHPAETLTEMVLGAFYALMFSWAHLEGYPLRTRALAAARFLGEAMAGAPQKTRRRRT